MSTPAKLMAAGGFVLFVGFMIGGENRPGPVMWAQQATEDTFGKKGNPIEETISTAPPTPQPTIAASDSELDSWYGDVQIGQYNPNPPEQQETREDQPQPPASVPQKPPGPGTVVPEGGLVEIIN